MLNNRSEVGGRGWLVMRSISIDLKASDLLAVCSVVLGYLVVVKGLLGPRPELGGRWS